MQIGQIWKSKTGNHFINIDSFITRIGQDYDEVTNPLYVVISNLQMIDYSLSYTPSSNKYGTQEEIEKDYELYLEAISNPLEYEKQIAKIEEILKQN